MDPLCLLAQIVNIVQYFSTHSHKFSPLSQFLEILFHVSTEWIEDDVFSVEFPREIYLFFE
jgi:hypothetical protein